jgi:hypothetical protein
MERRWTRWRVWIVFILVVVVTALIVIPRAEGAGMDQKAVSPGPGVITIACNRFDGGTGEKQAMTLAGEPNTMRSMK